MRTPKLKVRMDGEIGELHTLAGCQGFHFGHRGVSPGCVACYEGIWGEPDREGTNGLLAYFSLLAGSRHLRGLEGWDSAGGDTVVRLYANDAVFVTEATGDPLPVWAVIVKEHTDQSHGVAVYTTLAAGEAAYRRVVDEFYVETDCALGLEHVFGEPCECAVVPDARLDLRRDPVR